jgi:hypothetical protein
MNYVRKSRDECIIKLHFATNTIYYDNRHSVFFPAAARSYPQTTQVSDTVIRSCFFYKCAVGRGPEPETTGSNISRSTPTSPIPASLRCPQGIQEDTLLYFIPYTIPFLCLLPPQPSSKVLFGHFKSLRLPSCSIPILSTGRLRRKERK